MIIDPASVSRICISRMKFIGDIILTTPLIRSVREKFPEAFITYLGEKEGVSLLRHHPDLNEIISFDFARPTIIEQVRVIRELRKKKFDLFIDLFCNPRTAMIARASGASIRIGKEVRGRGSLYTHRISDNGKPKTAIEFHYQYLQPLGIEPGNHAPKIFLTEDERREARTFLKWQDIDLDRPIIGLHPGATWPAKMWEWEKFADLADLIRAKLKAQVVITQGPGDKEIALNVSQRSVGSNLLLPVVPIRQLAAMISQFKVFVSNDAGPMHIGPAVGTKTIGIFGPGEENIWFPYHREDGHLPLRKNVACHPCHLDFCNRSQDEFMECMKLLSVREVLAEVEKRMQNPIGREEGSAIRRSPTA